MKTKTTVVPYIRNEIKIVQIVFFSSKIIVRMCRTTMAKRNEWN